MGGPTGRNWDARSGNFAQGPLDPALKADQAQAAQKTATDDEVVAEITPAGKANFAAPGKPAVKRPSPSDDSDSEEVEELAKKRKETGTTSGKKESKPIKVDASFLKNIDLEVLELRASLDFQGLHRDSIEDICDEKRPAYHDGVRQADARCGPEWQLQWLPRGRPYRAELGRQIGQLRTRSPRPC